jgi:hypothetical protein
VSISKQHKDIIRRLLIEARELEKIYLANKLSEIDLSFFVEGQESSVLELENKLELNDVD